MPVRGHSTAPKFDGRPQLLNHFFDDVGYLADQATLNNTEKIRWACRYAEFDEAELWESLTERNSNSFADFQAAVCKLYPGVKDDRKYSVADLDCLTESQACIGINNRTELGEYHRKFIIITSFLKSKTRISDPEWN